MPTPEEWHEYRLAVQIGKLYGQNGIRDLKGRDLVYRIKAAQRLIRSFRTTFGPTHWNNFKDRAINSTRSKIQRITDNTMPRSDVLVTIGKGKYIRRIKRASFEIGVGYMWIKRVYPFYRDGWIKLYPDWFVLEATPIKSNIRDARLFVAKMNNQKTNTTEERYIAQSNANRKAIGQGKTPAIARSQMEKVMVEQFMSEVGENQ